MFNVLVPSSKEQLKFKLGIYTVYTQTQTHYINITHCIAAHLNSQCPRILPSPHSSIKLNCVTRL